MKTLERNIKRIFCAVFEILIFVSFLILPVFIDQSYRINIALGTTTGIISFTGVRLSVIVENTFKKYTNGY